MARYLVRRVVLAIPVLFGASIVIFALARLMPGDVVDRMIAQEPSMTPEQTATLRRLLGLDEPMPLQYLHWLGDLAHGDLGFSLWARRSVADILAPAIPVTVELMIIAIVISVLLAFPAGIVSALRPNTVVDAAVRLVSMLGLAIPHFWAAILLLLVASKGFGWLPPLFYAPLTQDPLANLAQMAMPAVTLAWALTASTSRMLRSTLLETLGQDYMRTARAKGLATRAMVFGHALKNALIPVVTIIGLQIGGLLGGSVIIEQIFGLPGLGWTILNAIFERDYPVVQVAVLLLTVMYIVINLAVDVVYAYIDPRVRYA
jgi:peptide/nickel transport system permease protein